MLATLRHYPTTVVLLLASSLFLTLGRAITLPYLVVYLSTDFALSISDIGVVVGSALIFSSLLSLYGGYLSDKVSSFRLILFFTGLFVLGFLGMCLTRHIWLFFIFLVAFNFAYSAIAIVAKSAFGKLLPEHERSKAFSLRYTLINIGYAVGPFIGAGLFHLNMSLPFLVSAALGAGFFLVYFRWGDRTLSTDAPSDESVSFLTVGKLLIQDRRLVCFTIGGVLSAVVFSQFTAWISQYLVITSSPEYTYEVISAVVAVNALVVVTLQYTIGKRISYDHLIPWLTAGLSLFLLGVVGFALSISVLQWSIAMAIFSLGEAIVFPVEFMFIDRIAPDHLRGMYYGAQSLSNLGGALGPVLCGFALATGSSHLMFYLLAGFIVAGGCFYLMGASFSRAHERACAKG
jgi:MFS family permease